MVELADLIRPGAGRGLDFVIPEELRKRTGVPSFKILMFAVSEMLANSLDTDASEIHVEVQTVGKFDEVTLRDNGTRKISIEELNLILDFENKASSKRGFFRVSRGYLGNALKCIFGYSYALSEAKKLTPPEIQVNSHGTEYRINLKPDKMKEVIDSEITAKETEDASFNSFTVRFPIDRSWTRNYLREDTYEPVLELDSIHSVIVASGMVNPSRRLTYKLWDSSEGEFGEPTETPPLRQDTSILWYEPKQFETLFYDFVRARPETQLKEFISLFRGFTSKKIQKVVKEKLQELNDAGDHDSQGGDHVQFFPAAQIEALSREDVKRLYTIMMERAKPIAKRSISKVLGAVGRESFERVREQRGWKRLRYTLQKGREKTVFDFGKFVSFPFLVELAVFDRDEDERGLKVFQAVNFSASMEDLFSKIFDIRYRLGRVGITERSPVTVLAHLVCPVLGWLNYGKSGLIGSRTTTELMRKAFDEILPVPKAPRIYRPPPPPKPVSWVPSGNLKNHIYRERLRDFAKEIRAIDARRTKRIKYSSRGWCYALEGLGLIDKGEFKKAQKALNDCRKEGFLPIDFVAADQDLTRRFAGIHEAADPADRIKTLKEDIKGMLENLPSYTTDYWEDEEYYLMMCCEKGDLRNLFKPICGEYYVPVVSSKGWYPILLRAHIVALSRKAEKRGLKPVLLLFYDLDPAGTKITDTFLKGLFDISGGTGWEPWNLEVYRFGLNKKDIDRYGLTWIENLKTGSGREAKASDYVRKYGRRKCESNALFKNDETLEAGEKICREAIEKYYGKDALERFKEKEKKAKENLGVVYEDPLWDNLENSLDSLIGSLSVKAEEEEEEPPESEKISEVEIFRKSSGDKVYYGRCPSCGSQFDYDEEYVDRTVRCRQCNAPMKLVKTGEDEEENIPVVEEASEDGLEDDKLHGTCPECGRTLIFDEEFLGHTVRCKPCNALITFYRAGEVPV